MHRGNSRYEGRIDLRLGGIRAKKEGSAYTSEEFRAKKGGSAYASREFA